MTADVELLPLPAIDAIVKYVEDYARANVALATAAKDAEIEALRTEVARAERLCSVRTDETVLLLNRTERLAEALREIEGFTLSQFAGLHDMAAACIERASRALLREQEK